MDQDKTTVMGGYGSAQAGDSADATRVVPNPGYTDPAATQPSAEPTRVMGYGDTAQDSCAASSQGPYGNAAPDPFDYASQDSYAASTPNPYDDLPQNPIPQPQQTTYMPRTAQPRYESREPYREYPKSIPQYGEDEEKKSARCTSSKNSRTTFCAEISDAAWDISGVRISSVTSAPLRIICCTPAPS